MAQIATSQRRVLNPPKQVKLIQNLSTGPLRLDTATDRPFALNYITFKTSSNTIQEIVVTILSNEGEEFNSEVLRERICLKDFIYQPPSELTLEEGNQIRAEVTNLGKPFVQVRILISTQEI